jgi:intracellular septation protein A
MIKPTVIYLTIGAAMLQRGWMERYIPPQGRALVPDRVFIGWGYVWAGMMFLTAVANLVIAVALGHRAWLVFVGAFPLASKLALFAVNYLHIRHVAMRNHHAQEAAAAVGDGQPLAA